MKKNFLFSTSSKPVVGSNQSPIHWLTEALSPGEKQPESEAEYLPNSAEVKKTLPHTPS
jgi:hypothetical protein